MRVDHRFFSVNGLRLHALDYGGAGHPILLVHGRSGHAAIWRDVAAPLSLWGTVYALDLRGHGDSQWSPDGTYDADAIAEDVSGVAAQLSDGPVDIVGLCTGGVVGMKVAAAQPEKVRRLAVLDTPVSTAHGHLATTGPARLDGPYTFDGEDALLAYERSSHPRALPSLIDHLAAQSTRPAPEGKLARKHDPVVSEVFAAEAEDLVDLTALTVPTLLVRAAESEVLSPDAFAALGAAVREARCEVVRESGHLIPVDNPAELADLLVDFLGEGDIDEF